MKHTITLIPGDGIGPEVASNVVRIIEAAGAQVEWETHYAGAQALEKFGDTLPKNLLDSIKRNKVALKGPVTTQVGKGFKDDVGKEFIPILGGGEGSRRTCARSTASRG